MRRTVIDEDVSTAGDVEVMGSETGDHNYDRVDRRRVDHQWEATGLRQGTPLRRAVIVQVSRGNVGPRE